jgi:hypothetical protein
VVLMLRRLLVYVFLAGTGLAPFAIGGIAANAEPVYPPGLRVGLEPPAGMSPSPRFAGFEDTAQNATIAILDLPLSAYPQLETAAFNEVQQDLDQPKRESFPFESGIGFLISGIGHKDGIAVHRWSLLAQAVGGSVQNLTALVNVEVPESAFSVYSDAVVRKALASVTFRPTPIQEQLEYLPFKLGDLAGFHVAQVSRAGGVILADKTADMRDPQPFMVISMERGGPIEPGDRARFARDLMTNAPVRDLSLQSMEPMRIGGAPGQEIRAQGKSPTGDPVSMVQWIRFSSGGFLRLIAVSPTDKWDQSFARFRTVRDGIETR